MKYAISDLHGCYDKYIRLLEKIRFSEEDELYVLGDVCDRNAGGIRILLDMMSRPNVIPIQGNHDYLAQIVLSHLETDVDEKDDILTLSNLWKLDGGALTAKAFLALDKPTQERVLSYWSTFQYYETVSAGGKNFFLSHTLPAYEAGCSAFDYPPLMFVLGEPDYEKTYFPGTYTVTGHTPTGLIDPACAGRIWKGNGHIVIDCGAVFGNPLGCLCLDTLEEIYTE